MNSYKEAWGVSNLATEARPWRPNTPGTQGGEVAGHPSTKPTGLGCPADLAEDLDLLADPHPEVSPPTRDQATAGGDYPGEGQHVCKQYMRTKDIHKALTEFSPSPHHPKRGQTPSLL